LESKSSDLATPSYLSQSRQVWTPTRLNLMAVRAGMGRFCDNSNYNVSSMYLGINWNGRGDSYGWTVNLEEKEILIGWLELNLV